MRWVIARVLFSDLHEFAVGGATEGILSALLLVDVFITEEGKRTENGDVHHFFSGETGHL
jgi:hypothetical protein